MRVQANVGHVRRERRRGDRRDREPHLLDVFGDDSGNGIASDDDVGPFLANRRVKVFDVREFRVRDLPLPDLLS